MLVAEMLKDEIKKTELCCNLILKFDADMLKIIGSNPLRRAVMGFYGEQLVANYFRKKGFSVENKGNLAGYDLLVNNQKIEVRTSELKEERAFPKEIKAWGWKLQTRDRAKKPNPIKYDYICLVKLEKDWSKNSIFLFSKKDVERVDITYFGGYQTVARVIYLFKDSIKIAKKNDKYKMITPECISFNKNSRKHLINNKIKSFRGGN